VRGRGALGGGGAVSQEKDLMGGKSTDVVEHLKKGHRPESGAGSSRKRRKWEVRKERGSGVGAV